MTIRRTLMVAVACLVATAACTNSPQRLAGQAGPDGAASPTPPTTSPPPVTAKPSVSSSPTAAKTSAAPKKSSRPPIKRVIGPANVLGPTGLGKLQIGMSKKDAEATGMVVAAEGEGNCGTWMLNREGAGSTTVSFTARGVVNISAFGNIATPEGIRLGSNLSDVKKAYDDLTGIAIDQEGGSWGDGLAFAGQTDKYGGVHYRFFFVNAKVFKMDLEHDQPRC